MKTTTEKKHIRVTFNAPAVLIFAIICLAALILSFLTGGLSTRVLFSTFRSSWTNPLTYIRMFTHVFGHSGWDHLFGNMSFILLLGPILEEKYGTKKIVWIMALTALVTGIVHCFFMPDYGLCGASGIVFAFILLISFTSFKEGELPVTVILVALIYIGKQVYEGIAVHDNISNLAHIIGGMVGAIVGYQWNKK
ncbi:MAG: rhomboid family intramembrane serine protease [Lachnospiraceae bacterium]|nr:rhomboid family intramembrane serine protease [Lachnospiraceae bacterium]